MSGLWPSPAAEVEQSGGPRRKRKRLRRLWRALVFTVIIVTVLWVVVARTGVTKSLVLPRIVEATGLDLDASSVVFSPDLRLVVRDAVVRLPGMPGAAAEFARVDRLEATVDWAGLLSGQGFGLARVEVFGPKIRVSQDRETGRLSVSAFEFDAPDRGETDFGELPLVTVRDAVIEIGEHERSGYWPLAAFEGDGEMLRSAETEDPRYVLRFELHPEGEPENAANAVGRLDERGLELTLSGMAIDAWEPAELPERLRSVLDQLQIAGDVRPNRISVSTSGELLVEVALDGVALNVPGTEVGTGPDGRQIQQRPLRLTAVTGALTIDGDRLSADIGGLADRLRYRVRFDTDGLRAQSAPFVVRLETEPFRLERDLRLLRFVPDVVNDRLEMFGKPTAEVRSLVWIVRGPLIPLAERRATGLEPVPMSLVERVESSDEIQLLGALEIRDGVAAYRGFPYRIRGMSGRFEFDRSELRIVGLEGVGHTGARLRVDGFIGPLGPTAEVSLDIRIEDAPLDEELNLALSPGRRKVIAELFDRDEHARLIERGLILPAERADELRAEAERLEVERAAWSGGGSAAAAERARIDSAIAEINAELARAPEFRLGGVFDADIRVHREQNDKSIWTRDIRPIIRDAGLVTKAFPMPLRSDGIAVRITDEIASIEPSMLRPLVGSGEVVLSAELELGGDPDDPPRVDISASGVEINDLLLHAVSRVGRQRLSIDAAETLNKLDLAGTLGCEAWFDQGDDGQLAYEVKVDIERANATPRRPRAEGEPRLLLSGVRGGVVIRRDEADIDLTMSAATVGGGLSPTPAGVRAELRATPGVPGVRLNAEIDADGADAALPVHQAIWVFAPTLAGRLDDLRTRFDPAGILDVRARIAGRVFADGFEPAVVSATSDRIEWLSATTPLGRVHLAESSGRVGIVSTGLPIIVTEGFSAKLIEPASAGARTAVGGPSAGIVRASGWLPIDPDAPWPATGVLGQPGMSVALRSTSIESRLVDALLRSRLSDDALVTLAELDLAGRFDASLVLTPAPAGTGSIDGDAARPWFRTAGRVTPRSLSFTRGGRRVSVDQMTGSLALDPGGGSFRGLSGVGDGWSFDIDGDWASVEGGAWSLDASGDVALDGLAPDAIALLPPAVVDVFGTLELAAEGPIRVRRGKLSWSQPVEGRAAVLTSGEVVAERLAMRLGLPVRELAGTIGFETWTADGGHGSRPEDGYRLDIAADRLRVSGLRMRSLSATVLSGATPGEVRVPRFTADAHGGRVTGSVNVGEAVGPARPYAIDLDMANVRLAPLLEDMRVSEAGGAAEGEGSASAGVWDRSEDRTRGTVTARLSLGGFVGQDVGREGRGEAIARGGAVLAVPLMMPLIEFSNLQLPSGSSFDTAEARFYIRDDRLTFEHLRMDAGSVSLVGFGTMTWPGSELDLRFASKTGQRWPVLSDLIEGVRDELLTTRVTGRLAEPAFSAESLPTTRRLLSALLGVPESEAGRRIRELEAEARRSRGRADPEAEDRVFERRDGGGDG